MEEEEEEEAAEAMAEACLGERAEAGEKALWRGRRECFFGFGPGSGGGGRFSMSSSSAQLFPMAEMDALFFLLLSTSSSSATSLNLVEEVAQPERRRRCKSVSSYLSSALTTGWRSNLRLSRKLVAAVLLLDISDRSLCRRSPEETFW